MRRRSASSRAPSAVRSSMAHRVPQRPGSGTGAWPCRFALLCTLAYRGRVTLEPAVRPTAARCAAASARRPGGPSSSRPTRWCATTGSRTSRPRPSPTGPGSRAARSSTTSPPSSRCSPRASPSSSPRWVTASRRAPPTRTCSTARSPSSPTPATATSSSGSECSPRRARRPPRARPHPRRAARLARLARGLAPPAPRPRHPRPARRDLRLDARRRGRGGVPVLGPRHRHRRAGRRRPAPAGVLRRRHRPPPHRSRPRPRATAAVRPPADRPPTHRPSPEKAPMSSLLYRLGRWCAAHAWRTLAIWLVVLVGVGALAGTVGKPLTSQISIPGTEFEKVLDRLGDEIPEAAGGAGTVVLESGDAPFTDEQQAPSRTSSRPGRRCRTSSASPTRSRRRPSSTRARPTSAAAATSSRTVSASSTRDGPGSGEAERQLSGGEALLDQLVAADPDDPTVPAARAARVRPRRARDGPRRARARRGRPHRGAGAVRGRPGRGRRPRRAPAS